MTTKDDLINYFNNISSLFEKLCTSLNPSVQIEEKDFPFFKDMGETFFKVYGEIVEKRKGKPYSENDRDHQLKLHGKWTQWALLEDEGTKYGLDKGIPPDALLRAILPPTAKF